MSDLLTASDIEARAGLAGISMAEVCRRAGVAQSTFTRWKAGKTEPTLDIYRKLRDAASPLTDQPQSDTAQGRIPMTDETSAGRDYGVAETPAAFVFHSSSSENYGTAAGSADAEAAEIFARIDRDLLVEEARADRLLRFYHL